MVNVYAYVYNEVHFKAIAYSCIQLSDNSTPEQSPFAARSRRSPVEEGPSAEFQASGGRRAAANFVLATALTTTVHIQIFTFIECSMLVFVRDF